MSFWSTFGDTFLHVKNNKHRVETEAQGFQPKCPSLFPQRVGQTPRCNNCFGVRYSSCTNESVLPFQLVHIFFSSEWGETMRVKSLAQGLNTKSLSHGQYPQPCEHESNALTKTFTLDCLQLDGSKFPNLWSVGEISQIRP